MNVMLNSPKYSAGLSLIELLVALVISSLLMLGLVASFKTSSDTQKELEKAGLLIENGRYAVNLMSDDLRHAGYFGHFFELGDPPTTLQDPCETANLTNLRTAMGMSLQGYTAPSITARITLAAYKATWDTTTTCDNKGFFTDANLAPGSDVVVVRRADTQIFTGVPVDNEIYLQANNRDLNILAGNDTAGTVDGTNPASKTVANQVQTLRKYPTVDDADWADTRKYHVHVYFVAPCSIGSDTNGVCQAGDDDIPTLKRLELTSVSGATTMELVPLVEGIEYLKMEYGIDTSPADVNVVTGLSGDSVPDSYITTPTAAQWPFVVTARVYVLTRATETTTGYTDVKSYILGTIGGGTDVAAANDAYTRHVFSAEVRPSNLAGRREIPE